MHCNHMGRFELLLGWHRVSQQLERQGEQVEHLQRFLQQVQALPGDDVGDILLHWHRSQANKQSTAAFLTLCGALLVAVLALLLIGVGAALVSGMAAAGVGIRQAERLRQQESAFVAEVDLRARYLMNCPTVCAA
jgi:hypothetical protein